MAHETPGCQVAAGCAVGSDACRAALARVLASPAFQASPKLAAFLRFVVEAALAGQADRIKGYTIGTEALGRGKDFDPQSDPIVRVEAGRLRRTLDAYYATLGAHDPIIIALPVGSYVPTFTPRAVPAPTVGRATSLRDRWLRQRPATSAAAATAIAAIALFGAVHVVVMHSPPDTSVTGSIGTPAIGATRDVGTEIYRTAAASPRIPLHSGLPMVYVRPFTVIGASSATSDDLMLLHEGLVDAFSRFDEIEVRAEPAPSAASLADDRPRRSEYELATVAEFAADGTIRLSFRLVDLRARTVAWSRSYDRSRVPRDDIVQDLATALAQPYGAIYAAERAKRVAGGDLDPRYACLLDAFEAWRSYDAVKQDQVRACLEATTRADPNFAGGFAALSTLDFREYAFGFGAGSVDRPALDRALAAAQHAVELKPESARAHQTLMGAHFFRGELDQAREQGEKAVSLNPYDMYVAGDYGARLIFMGDDRTGAALLQRYLDSRKARSGRGDFALFLAAYLRDDDKATSFQAGQLTNDQFPLGVMARALNDERTGDHDGATRELQRLFALNTAWRDDPRGTLRRFFPAPLIVDRLAGDLDRVRAGAVMR